MKKGTLLLFLLQLAIVAFAQDTLTNVLNYEVKNVYPSLSMSKEKLDKAENLCDLNNLYRPTWVREYYAVETSITHNGAIKKINSENDIISPEQKELMKMADIGTDISIKIKYLPENNLKNNEPREMNFSFLVNPEKGAEYIGGHQQMTQYLKEQVVDKIPEGVFKGYDLAGVKFIIDEEGHVVDSQILWTSKDETIDQLLLATISKMSCWNPAEYVDGTKVKQEFVFTVGNPENCMVNILNTSQD